MTNRWTNASSYEQFAEGYFLTAKAIAWFWDAYLPLVERRSEPFASPLRASDEQLAGLPSDAMPERDLPGRQRPQSEGCPLVLAAVLSRPSPPVLTHPINVQRRWDR